MGFFNDVSVYSTRRRAERRQCFKGVPALLDVCKERDRLVAYRSYRHMRRLRALEIFDVATQGFADEFRSGSVLDLRDEVNLFQ